MSRTIRDRHKTKARDGNIWRDCGDKHCIWCIENRQNVKIKAKLFANDQYQDSLRHEP